MFRRNRKVVLVATITDLRLMRESLFALRDSLINEGRHTDPVDELIAKILT